MAVDPQVELDPAGLWSKLQWGIQGGEVELFFVYLVPSVPAGHLPPVIPQRLLAGQEPVFGSQERRILQDLVERVGEEGLQLRAPGRVAAAGMLNPGQGS